MTGPPRLCAASRMSVFQGVCESSTDIASGFSYYTTAPTDLQNGFILTGCVSSFPAGSTTVLPARVRASGYATGLEQTTVTGPVQMWGQPVTVAYASSDVRLFVPAGSSAPRTTTLPTSTQATNPGSTADSGGRSSGGLSVGAAAGIAIAATIAVVFLAALAAFLIVRRRKRLATGGGGSVAFMFGHIDPKGPRPTELSADTRPHEVGAHKQPVELG